MSKPCSDHLEYKTARFIRGLPGLIGQAVRNPEYGLSFWKKRRQEVVSPKAKPDRRLVSNGNLLNEAPAFTRAIAQLSSAAPPPFLA